LGSSFSLAGETADADLFETDDAIGFGVDGEITAHVRARTGLFGLTDLADEYFAGTDGLAAKALHTEALARRIMDVFGCTTCFDV
jgi:hypothetical protein